MKIFINKCKKIKEFFEVETYKIKTVLELHIDEK